ncbi:hypothetical protein HNQ80_000934 [Anaerosolibacter carboniphilus]|uniref:DUF2905 domain-containing protein n=1 Tax=Anaerosolibacter carboniphilus TaxID=1417629 RepID=A0A841KXD5_9FIRM|nr:DUF2905 domain-containing protein [Anaerosolibacter carboniphilus]MBB6214849.1 hypothetical protein [Anaerosolibacter carboniphilus]
MNNPGRLIIILGIILIAVGILVTIGSRFGLGKLPGDIYFKKGNFTFYAPMMTTFILSILLTLILNLFLRK